MCKRMTKDKIKIIKKRVNSLCDEKKTEQCGKYYLWKNNRLIKKIPQRHFDTQARISPDDFCL